MKEYNRKGWLDGSCPICYVGEVDGYKCDRCGTEFCSQCYGTINVRTKNVLPCECAMREQ